MMSIDPSAQHDLFPALVAMSGSGRYSGAHPKGLLARGAPPGGLNHGSGLWLGRHPHDGATAGDGDPSGVGTAGASWFPPAPDLHSPAQRDDQ
jgi:hypothetical protein